jgi:porin
MAAMLTLLQVHPGRAQNAPFPATLSAQHGQENGPAPSDRSNPISLALTYGSDLNVAVSGGQRTGAQYLGRIGIIADADLDQLLGWHGATAHISVHQIHGRGLSQHRIGNLLTVSGLEAEPALRLFNLWVQQSIGSRATLRIGQFTAGQEFAISDTAAIFVNSTFGWPGSFATDLPSGGPAYPLAAPGIRLSVAADARTSLRLAVFAGDPAGPGGGDPQRRDLHGFNGLRLAGRPFLIGEVQRSSGGDHPAVTIRAGFWLHLDRFADVRFDAAGRSLALAGPGAQALQHRGNAGLYGIVDVALWHRGADPARSVRGFFRASFSPPDRNVIDLYADGGVAVTGPLRGRPADILGLGFAIARISPALRSLARDYQGLTGLANIRPDYEAVVELSYQLPLGNGISVQPNVQYIIHPGARLPPSGGAVATPDALIVGLRASVRL